MEVEFVIDINGVVCNHTPINEFATSAEVRRYARQIAEKVNGKVLHAFNMRGDKIPLGDWQPSRKSLLGE